MSNVRINSTLHNKYFDFSHPIFFLKSVVELTVAMLNKIKQRD